MEEKVKDMVEQKTIYRVLKTNFTEKEKLDMAGQIANCIREKKSNEDELASISSQYKSNVKRLEAEIAGFAEKLNTGWEMRRAECFEIRDYATGNLSVIRKETGEVVEERALTGEERQMGLFEEKDGEAPAADGGEKSPQSMSAGEPGVEGAEATPEPSPDLPEDTNPFYQAEAKKKGSLKMLE